MSMPPSFYCRKSFSQSVEDIILLNLFRRLGTEKNVKYLDIGANHPFVLSNTAMFYLNNTPKGGGVLVEPNPYLCSFLKRRRKKDVVLNLGLSENGKKKGLPFYIMNSHVLSTFSKDVALQYEEMGYKIEKVIDIKVENINNILKKYFSKGDLDFISSDTEGLDYEILSSINFELYKPKVICVETYEYSSRLSQGKEEGISTMLSEKGYLLYARTPINTIFIDRKIF